MPSKHIYLVPLVLLCMLSVIVTPTRAAQRPSGAEVIKIAQAKSQPLGFAALRNYENLRTKPFEENIKFSNRWIKSHIDYYDKKASAEYRAYTKDMIDGGGDVSLGMRRWLTDPQNVAWWDNTIRKLVGDEGYARVVALNAAFPPGSENYRLTYGGTRRFDPKTNNMSLNGTSRKINGTVTTATGDQLFDRMVTRGDGVRQQMLSFYAAYAKGKVSAAQVKKFNEGVIIAGGCALSATEAKEADRSIRYMNAVNFMGAQLDSLGFPSKR